MRRGWIWSDRVRCKTTSRDDNCIVLAFLRLNLMTKFRHLKRPQGRHPVPRPRPRRTHDPGLWAEAAEARGTIHTHLQQFAQRPARPFGHGLCLGFSLTDGAAGGRLIEAVIIGKVIACQLRIFSPRLTQRDQHITGHSGGLNTHNHLGKDADLFGCTDFLCNARTRRTTARFCIAAIIQTFIEPIIASDPLMALPGVAIMIETGLVSFDFRTNGCEAGFDLIGLYRRLHRIDLRAHPVERAGFVRVFRR